MLEILHLDKKQEFLYFDAIDLLFREFPESRRIQEFYINPEGHMEKTMVVLEKGQAIAALKRGYNPVRDAMTIDFVAVKPECRWTGIGKKLLSEFEKFAKERQNKKVGLMTRLTTNVSEFYKKQGYVFIPEYEPAWMEKEI